MRNLTATICLTVVVLFGYPRMGWSSDYTSEFGELTPSMLLGTVGVSEWMLLAEQGNAAAHYELGVMYAKGKGVIQDNIYAHMWMNIAASSGIKNAVKNREIIVNKMTTAEISEAENLARECIAKNYKEC